MKEKANEMVEKILNTNLGKRILRGHIIRKDLDEMTVDDINDLYCGVGCDDYEHNKWFWETFGTSEYVTLDDSMKLYKRPQEEIDAHRKAGIELSKEFVAAVNARASEICNDDN